MIITFGDALELDLHCAEGEPPRLTAMRGGGAALAAESPDAETRGLLPLSHIELAGHARDHINGKRHIGGGLSARLEYVSHEIIRSGEARAVLEITSHDPVTDLTVVACLEQRPGVAAVRGWTRVTAGARQVVLLHVTSLLIPGVPPIDDGDLWENRLTAWTAVNPWCTERLLPLVEAAAKAGAEYFVVDAGWYDDTDGWWDSVGEWEPSTVRFPGGLKEVTDLVRERGMIPGLWLEPEVVGVRSPMAARLPDGAFFQRAGRRLTERGRHQLDLRNPAAWAHLDATIDRLVTQFGLGYFKFGYNIEIGPGTDHDADSAGDGLLGHNRAYLAWLGAVLERHPGLVIENCSSGGMRTDHAMLATAQLHSAADQTDFRLLPAIAAAVPMAVNPEQPAMWAYPVPAMTDRETAFNLAGALLGRVHLSGRLDLLRPGQEALVAEALTAYRELRAHLPASVPHRPLGLPAWRAPWTALALEVEGAGGTDGSAPAGYVLVWHRDDERPEIELPVSWVGDKNPLPEVVYPASAAAETDLRWNQDTHTLTVALPRWPAVLIRLTAR
jgi:Melibiase